MHPWERGELAMGDPADRAGTRCRFGLLPTATVAREAEIAALIERVPLRGRDIGYVDACLLASTLLPPQTRRWTRNRRLHAAAEELGGAW